MSGFGAGFVSGCFVTTSIVLFTLVDPWPTIVYHWKRAKANRAKRRSQEKFFSGKWS